MVALLGALGSSLLALCALPEVIASFRKGYCRASLGLLITWLLGECITLLYVFITSKDIFLLLNYSSNCIMILVLLYYRSKPIRPEPMKTFNCFLDLKE